jgi:hypothetical protein
MYKIIDMVVGQLITNLPNQQLKTNFSHDNHKLCVLKVQNYKHFSFLFLDLTNLLSTSNIMFCKRANVQT